MNQLSTMDLVENKPLAGLCLLLALGLWGLQARVFAQSHSSSSSSTDANSNVSELQTEQSGLRVAMKSDVTLALQSGVGTNEERLTALGQAVQKQMNAIKACYAELVERDAKMQGVMKLQLTVPARKNRPRVEMADDKLADASHQKCVLRALEKVRATPDKNAASAHVILTFKNSAAKGVADVEEKREAQSKEGIARNTSGALQASSSTQEGEVSFTVNSQTANDAETLQAIRSGIKSNIGMLFDCHRKAGKGGVPSAGVMDLDLQISANGKLASEVTSSTVKSERAPECVRRAISRARFSKETFGHNYRITIRFADVDE